MIRRADSPRPEHTRGSYRALLGVRLAADRLQALPRVLHQQNCNLPVGPYRTARNHASAGSSAVRLHAGLLAQN
jgi:hypothetical protein